MEKNDIKSKKKALIFSICFTCLFIAAAIVLASLSGIYYRNDKILFILFILFSLTSFEIATIPLVKFLYDKMHVEKNYKYKASQIVSMVISFSLAIVVFGMIFYIIFFC